VAIITCHLHPAGLGISTTILIVVPATVKRKETVFPVLWLLHDENKNAQSLLYDCNLQRLADKRRVLIVAPDLQNSMGCNLKPTPDWETYLTQHLTAYIWNHFPASRLLSQNVLAGVGTGGYAAFRLVLTYPALYSAAIGIASQVDLPQRYAQGKVKPQQLKRLSHCFGQNMADVVGSEADCFSLAKNLVASGAFAPTFFVCSSDKDLYYRGNQRFCAHLKRLSIPFYWTETIDCSMEELLMNTLCHVFGCKTQKFLSY
jgi:S-formylglutathione hydrolase FrmB